MAAEANDAARATTDRMAVFGPEMRAVLKQIERTQWQQKPVGPMARHVKLKAGEKQWARPVNMALEHQFRVRTPTLTSGLAVFARGFPATV